MRGRNGDEGMGIWMTRLAPVVAAVAALFGGAAAAAPATPFAGVACQTPPPAFCTEKGCPPDLMAAPGNAVDPKTGRRFFLDFPCGLKRGDKVIFILSLHGATSAGAWQRNYFRAAALKDKYRLVIASPTAGNAQRIWSAADDAHLQNVADMVIGELGARNIKAFWLAGHSQGGLTANRVICNDYFKGRVDGLLSLSGGRIGRAAPAPALFDGRPPPTGAGGSNETPACDFNYIFETGDREMVALPEVSPWAEKYGCGPRVRQREVKDTKPGFITGERKTPPNPAYGLDARPGVAQVMVYPKCNGGKLVADVVRLEKGHTEGLEPAITETLIQMIAAAPSGKLR